MIFMRFSLFSHSQGIVIWESLAFAHFRRQMAPQYSRNCGQKSPHSGGSRRQISKLLVLQKWLGTNKIVRTKIHTGSKFSKTSLGLLCTGVMVVVHPYCSFFSAASDGATVEHRIQKTFFVNFVGVWAKIASAFMDRFKRSFLLLDD